MMSAFQLRSDHVCVLMLLEFCIKPLPIDELKTLMFTCLSYYPSTYLAILILYTNFEMRKE